MNEQEIFQKLVPLIREVTGVAESKIRMESNLMEELGTESLDLLDLSFLIEENFGVILEADEFERRATERIPGGVFDRNGILTDEAVADLKKSLPEIPPEKFKLGMKKIELPGLLNVGVFVHIIQRKLDEKKKGEKNA
jgi:acyl carrier protein